MTIFPFFFIFSNYLENGVLFFSNVISVGLPAILPDTYLKLDTPNDDCGLGVVVLEENVL